MSDVYVAPAARVLTDLHIPGSATDAETRCGLPMAADDLWQPVQRQDGDRVCAACAAHVKTETASEALW